MRKLEKVILFWVLINQFFVRVSWAQPTPTEFLDEGQRGVTAAVTPPVQICTVAPPGQREDCLSCLLEKNGSWTVFGCLPHSPSAFAAFVLRFSLGIGGGVAFLVMVWGSFYLLTSAGNPGRINQGKKIIFYAGLGILVIIFSIFIFQLVGVQILGIPEFGQ